MTHFHSIFLKYHYLLFGVKKWNDLPKVKQIESGTEGSKPVTTFFLINIHQDIYDQDQGKASLSGFMNTSVPREKMPGGMSELLVSTHYIQLNMSCITQTASALCGQQSANRGQGQHHLSMESGGWPSEEVQKGRHSKKDFLCCSVRRCWVMGVEAS
jgi:hypothetical protein